MTEAILLSEKDEFWAVRGKSINSYANLEQSLVRMFALLSETNLEVASIILFRIASADARNKIIEKLFRRKLKDAYNLFRNSLFDQLRPIDRERNEIVHWNAVCKMGHDGEKTTAEVLLAPAAYASMKPPQFKAIDELRAFSRKCSFYNRLMTMFCGIVIEQHEDVPETDKQAWLDIFSRPIVYPPQENHPLFPKPKELEVHIQAFFV